MLSYNDPSLERQGARLCCYSNSRSPSVIRTSSYLLLAIKRERVSTSLPSWSVSFLWTSGHRYSDVTGQGSKYTICLRGWRGIYVKQKNYRISLNQRRTIFSQSILGACTCPPHHAYADWIISAMPTDNKSPRQALLHDFPFCWNNPLEAFHLQSNINLTLKHQFARMTRSSSVKFLQPLTYLRHGVFETHHQEHLSIDSYQLYVFGEKIDYIVGLPISIGLI